jgi:putative iron-only hydrogenase system regulator
VLNVEKRIGVIGIVLENRDNVAKLNLLLAEFANCIIGRMGVPYREKDISIISLIVEGTTDEIGALTGKLGSLKGVLVKTALTKMS